METSVKKNRKIEIGKIYFIHDGTRTGHPGIVVWKDELKNRYLVVKCDSDKFGETLKIAKGVRHITKLKHRVGKNVEASYVRNRPLLCKRKDIGKELPDLSIHKDDMKTINMIALRNPELGPSLKK